MLPADLVLQGLDFVLEEGHFLGVVLCAWIYGYLGSLPAFFFGPILGFGCYIYLNYNSYNTTPKKQGKPSTPNFLNLNQIFRKIIQP